MLNGRRFDEGYLFGGIANPKGKVVNAYTVFGCRLLTIRRRKEGQI